MRAEKWPKRLFQNEGDSARSDVGAHGHFGFAETQKTNGPSRSSTPLAPMCSTLAEPPLPSR